MDRSNQGLRDRKTTGELDTILIQRLKDRVLDKIWMAPPDILDWVDVKGFRYAKRKQAKIRLDLDLKEFLAELSNVDIDLNTLTNTLVFAISAATEDVFTYLC